MWLQLSHNDLDGMGCLLLGRKMGIKYSYICSYTENSKYYFGNVLSDFAHMFNDETIEGLLITDINLTPIFVDILEATVPERIKVISIDHHEDSVKEHNRYKIHHDTSLSATKIMYNLLKDKLDIAKYRECINAINGFDTWEFETSPFAVDLQRVFYYYVFMEEKFKYIKYFIKLNNFVDLLENDPPTNTYKPKWYNNFLAQYHERKDILINPIIENVLDMGGVYNVYKFKKNNYAPAFEVSIHAQNAGIENFILIFEDDNTFTVSLRTNSDRISVNEFASLKDGGGHQKASSFRIPLNEQELTNTLNDLQEFYSGG